MIIKSIQTTILEHLTQPYLLDEKGSTISESLKHMVKRYFSGIKLAFSGVYALGKEKVKKTEGGKTPSSEIFAKMYKKFTRRKRFFMVPDKVQHLSNLVNYTLKIQNEKIFVTTYERSQLAPQYKEIESVIKKFERTGKFERFTNLSNFKCDFEKCNDRYNAIVLKGQ